MPGPASEPSDWRGARAVFEVALNVEVGPMGDRHYDCEVNRGDLNMGWLRDTLNDRWEDGWRLSSMFEQAGNTVIVFEKRS